MNETNTKIRPTIELTHLSDSEYRLISRLIYEKFGINLGEQKRSLIAGRLNKVLRQYGFDSFKKYYDHVLSDPTGTAMTTLIDRISTNHTFFYREKDHFEFFSKKAIPEIVEILKKRESRELRIWCAGCSSGEEPYTLAILLLEHFDKELKLWDIGILATDISTRALEKAVAAVYQSDNVSRLPPALKHKYFRHRPDGGWVISDKVKSLVLYRKLNLMREDYPFKRKFQMIFCRNVMIYFDRPTRASLITRFDRYTEAGGYLFIGHSETLGRDHSAFHYVQPALYRKETSR